MGLEIKLKKLHADAIEPKYARHGDAGMDLFAYKDEIIPVGEVRKIPIGYSMEIPIGYELQIRPKSGLAINNGITVLNTPGTVDSGYRGEIMVILINHGKEDYHVTARSKVAQGVVTKVENVLFQLTDELSETQRGEGGFGSTGLT